MISKGKFLLATFLALAMSSCAELPRKGNENPQKAGQGRDLDLLHRQAVSAQERTARLEVNLSGVEQKLKTLATEMRRMQKRQSRIEESVARINRELISRTQSSRPGTRGVPPSRRRAVSKSIPQAADASARVASSPSARRKRPSSQASERSTRTTTDERETYNKAYRSVRERKSREAILLFRDFLQRFPNSPLAANAQYWLGESFYDLGEYPIALEAFQKVAERYPRSRKVPAAYYKRGITYLRLKDPRKAALEFEKLVDRFPSHPLTEKARRQIRTLNLSGNNRRG